MRFFRIALPLLGLLCGPALAQGWGQPPGPSGGANGWYWQINANYQSIHPSTGTNYSNTFLTTDTVNGTVNGVQESMRCNITTVGTGTLGTGGHTVCLQAEAYNNLTYQDLAIPIESVLANANGGTLNQGYNFLAKLSGNTGTMLNWYGLYPLVTNSGIITNYAEVECGAPAYNTGTIINSWCVQNTDPNQIIQTAGRIIGMNGEIGPPAIAAPYPGHYAWGVNHGAVAGTVTNLNTTTFWAPLYMGAQQVFGHIGVHVATAATGVTCNLFVYNGSYYGYPSGSPIYGPISISAAATGDVESNQSSPYYTLNAGLYWMGINCSSNSVSLSAYVENGLYTMQGPSTSSGSDVTPTTTGTTLGTNPAIAYISNGSVVPQIWVRR